MRIQPELSVGLLIDVQERLFPHIADYDVKQTAMVKLIQGFDILGTPLMVTEQYVKGLGKTVTALDSIRSAHSPVFEKMSFSCCGSDAFLAHLAQSGRTTVILFGIETHVCVLQTALDLLAAGYRVAVVEDAVGSRHESDKQTALARMRQEGVLPVSVESILLELCVTSGTSTFKAISQLIK